MHHRGFKLAILTSGGPKINDLLDHHGYSQYFSSVVHHERITNPKPDPEGFLLAAEECGVEPHKAVMVGGTVYDIDTGKNAGSHSTIAVTHGFGDLKDLQDSNPDFIVDDIFGIFQILNKY